MKTRTHTDATRTDRRSSNTSSRRHTSANRSSSNNRSNNGHRRRFDGDESNYDEDSNNGGSEGRDANGRRRNQNRRRTSIGNNNNNHRNNKNNNNNYDGDDYDENNEEYQEQVDSNEDEYDRKSESTSDYEDENGDDRQNEEDESSSRKGSGGRNRHRNRKRTYGSRRRPQGFTVDGQVPYPQESINKPFPKRPSDMVVPDLSNKPFPKGENSNEEEPSSFPRRRFKVSQKPYSAPSPAGFPSPIRPSVHVPSQTWTDSGSAFVISNPQSMNTEFVELTDGSSIDGGVLEDGATVVDTLTGQTYELSIDSNARRSSPMVSLVTDSVPQGPYLTKAAVIGSSGDSLDSLLGSLLIRPDQGPSGLSFIEPIGA